MHRFRHIFVRKVFVLLLCGLSLTVLMVIQQRQGAVETESLQPISKALDGIIIFVDAGHGGYDGGSRAKDSGIWEKVFNLRIALKTRDALTARGATVLLSREEDVDLCQGNLKGIAKKRQDLGQRIAIAQDGKADFVLSIHMNDYRDRRESGPHVFYKKNQDQSRLLAGCMQKALIDALNPTRRRVAQSGDYFMLSLPIPSVLIECGFISNPSDEKLLLTDAYQEKIAVAITNGLCDYIALASST